MGWGGGGGHWPLGDRSAGLPGGHLSPGEDLDPECPMSMGMASTRVQCLVDRLDLD